MLDRMYAHRGRHVDIGSGAVREAPENGAACLQRARGRANRATGSPPQSLAQRRDRPRRKSDARQRPEMRRTKPLGNEKAARSRFRIQKPILPNRRRSRKLSPPPRRQNSTRRRPAGCRDREGVRASFHGDPDPTPHPHLHVESRRRQSPACSTVSLRIDTVTS